MQNIDNDIKRFEALKQKKEMLEKKQLEIKQKLETLREDYKKNNEILKTS